jgi:hypothetical protein
VEAQPAQEAARWRREAALMKADEADDIPVRRVGPRSIAGGSIHAAGRPSSFAASWPVVTYSLRASLVAIERGHDSGSIMVMDYGGAMRIGEGARSAKRVLCDGEGASAAQGRKRKGRGRRALSVEVKIHLVLPLGFIDPWSHDPRITRSACINCRRTAQSLTGGTHHDRSGQAHARANITAWQPNSRGEPSRPPTQFAHCACGRGA